MPRQARLRIPGLPLHVIQRGHNKARCFRESRDYRYYLSLLDQLAPLFGCQVHAYVLMTNHVHLLLTPDNADGASSTMKHLGQRFAQYANRKYSLTGALFEGRFRSCLVDSDAYLLTCQRYIEMNPVRAGMVDHPSRYPWSSYSANGEGAPSDIVVPHDLYLGLANDPEERRRRYRALFDAPEQEDALDRIRAATNGNRILGLESFLKTLPDPARTRKPVAKPGRPATGDEKD